MEMDLKHILENKFHSKFYNQFESLMVRTFKMVFNDKMFLSCSFSSQNWIFLWQGDTCGGQKIQNWQIDLWWCHKKSKLSELCMWRAYMNTSHTFILFCFLYITGLASAIASPSGEWKFMVLFKLSFIWALHTKCISTKRFWLSWQICSFG